MAEPRPKRLPSPPRPDAPSVAYLYTKKISPKIIAELPAHEKKNIERTFLDGNYKLGTEIEVFMSEIGSNKNLVYAETKQANPQPVFLPKRVLETHFTKEKGHTTQEKGRALGKTMRRKHRKSRKSRKHRKSRRRN